MKLMVLCPAGRGRDGCVEHHKSAIESMRTVGRSALMSVGISHVELRYLEFCSMLPLARNLLAAIALAESADITFWVDDDIWFRTEDLVTAIASQLPIVGLPCLHKPDQNGEMHFNLNYDIFDNEMTVDPDKDWRPVRMIGTGMMIVRTEVYRAMQRRAVKFKKPDFTKQMPNINVEPELYDYFKAGPREMKGSTYYCGEDVGFCHDAAAVGYPTFMYCSGVTGHFSRAGFGAMCDYWAIREAVRAGSAKVDLLYHW